MLADNVCVYHNCVYIHYMTRFVIACISIIYLAKSCLMAFLFLQEIYCLRVCISVVLFDSCPFLLQFTHQNYNLPCYQTPFQFVTELVILFLDYGILEPMLFFKSHFLYQRLETGLIAQRFPIRIGIQQV